MYMRTSEIFCKPNAKPVICTIAYNHLKMLSYN